MIHLHHPRLRSVRVQDVHRQRVVPTPDVDDVEPLLAALTRESVAKRPSRRRPRPISPVHERWVPRRRRRRLEELDVRIADVPERRDIPVISHRRRRQSINPNQNSFVGKQSNIRAHVVVVVVVVVVALTTWPARRRAPSQSPQRRLHRSTRSRRFEAAVDASETRVAVWRFQPQSLARERRSTVRYRRCR